MLYKRKVFKEKTLKILSFFVKIQNVCNHSLFITKILIFSNKKTK